MRELIDPPRAFADNPTGAARVINRLATRLAMLAGALGDGLGRVAVRLSHLSSPGVLAILCVAALTAVQHLRRAAKRPD